MNTIVSWSGGKDSCLALLKAQEAGYKINALLTAMNNSGTFSKSNGVPIEIVKEQSKALGLPVINFNTSWKSYENDLLKMLKQTKSDFSAEYCVFGDINIQEHRDFEEKISALAGLKAVLPLWGMQRISIAEDIINSGIKAKISVIRENIPEEILGVEFDYNLLEKLKKWEIDVCGEGGEFHTVVYDAPSFKRNKFYLKQRKRYTLNGVKLIEFAVSVI